MYQNKDNNKSDQALVQDVLGGNSASFTHIIKMTEPLVSNIVYKMIHNVEDRKDLAQDIYMKAYRNLSGFKFKAKLSTWVAQIAYNTCINHLQKKKITLYDNLEDGANLLDKSMLVNTSQATLSEGESFLRNEELSNILTKQIGKLNEIQQLLISLYHQEEMSYEEIGEITKMPEGTVKNYLFRARKALRENILQNYKKEEL
jgi:RNA polymerase sigma factor (sigma-70 family)